MRQASWVRHIFFLELWRHGWPCTKRLNCMKSPSPVLGTGRTTHPICWEEPSISGQCGECLEAAIHVSRVNSSTLKKDKGNYITINGYCCHTAYYFFLEIKINKKMMRFTEKEVRSLLSFVTAEWRSRPRKFYCSSVGCCTAGLRTMCIGNV